MENNYLIIGYIVSTHGLQGGLKIKPATTFIDERFKVKKKVIVKHPFTNSYQTLTISKITPQKNLLIINFKEITTIEIAEEYLKCSLLIYKNEVKLKEGYFFYDDLIGMQVILEDNTFVGNVSEILEYASYNTLRIKRENAQDILVPYVDEFIISTDLERKMIVFRPIEGML